MIKLCYAWLTHLTEKDSFVYKKLLYKQSKICTNHYTLFYVYQIMGKK